MIFELSNHTKNEEEINLLLKVICNFYGVHEGNIDLRSKIFDIYELERLALKLAPTTGNREIVSGRIPRKRILLAVHKSFDGLSLKVFLKGIFQSKATYFDRQFEQVHSVFYPLVKVKFDDISIRDDKYMDYLITFSKNGFEWMGSNFIFFCSKEPTRREAYFLHNLNPKQIRNSLNKICNFTAMPKISTSAYRMKLLLSGTTKGLAISENMVNLVMLDDIYDNSICTSDGSGFVSEDLARQMPQNVIHGINYETPCISLGVKPAAFQIRIICSLGLFKGTLVVHTNPNISRTILLRPSMMKAPAGTPYPGITETDATDNNYDGAFTSSLLTSSLHIEIVNTSSIQKSIGAYLNKHLILNLFASGVPESVFEALIRTEAQSVNNLHRDANLAKRILKRRCTSEHHLGSSEDPLWCSSMAGATYVTVYGMICHGHSLTEPFIQSVLRKLREDELKALECLRLYCSPATYLMGIPDPTGTLLPGEVYIPHLTGDNNNNANSHRYSQPQHQKQYNSWIDGRDQHPSSQLQHQFQFEEENPQFKVNESVIVTRFPLLKPESIRKFTVLENEHLKSHFAGHGGVVVFSTRADEVGVMSGDYDGDLYFVCGDTRLVHSFINNLSTYPNNNTNFDSNNETFLGNVDSENQSLSEISRSFQDLSCQEKARVACQENTRDSYPLHQMVTESAVGFTDIDVVPDESVPWITSSVDPSFSPVVSHWFRDSHDKENDAPRPCSNINNDSRHNYDANTRSSNSNSKRYPGVTSSSNSVSFTRDVKSRTITFNLWEELCRLLRSLPGRVLHLLCKTPAELSPEDLSEALFWEFLVSAELEGNLKLLGRCANEWLSAADTYGPGSDKARAWARLHDLVMCMRKEAFPWSIPNLLDLIRYGPKEATQILSEDWPNILEKYEIAFITLEGSPLQPHYYKSQPYTNPLQPHYYKSQPYTNSQSFMKTRTYQSKSILGRLFDVFMEGTAGASVTSLSVPETDTDSSVSLDQDMRIAGSSDFLQLAQDFVSKYVNVVLQHGLDHYDRCLFCSPLCLVPYDRLQTEMKTAAVEQCQTTGPHRDKCHPSDWAPSDPVVLDEQDDHWDRVRMTSHSTMKVLTRFRCVFSSLVNQISSKLPRDKRLVARQVGSAVYEVVYLQAKNSLLCQEVIRAPDYTQLTSELVANVEDEISLSSLPTGVGSKMRRSMSNMLRLCWLVCGDVLNDIKVSKSYPTANVSFSGSTQSCCSERINGFTPMVLDFSESVSIVTMPCNRDILTMQRTKDSLARWPERIHIDRMESESVHKITTELLTSLEKQNNSSKNINSLKPSVVFTFNIPAGRRK